MAENVLMTRIQLKYDLLANWNASSLILKKGEVAIAEVPSQSSNSGLTPPAIGIKVGDGLKTFTQLPWIQAAAGDVHSWAKAAEKPTYTAQEISGLENYISGHTGDTIYQIIRGTNNDINKYFLQSSTDGGTTWTTVNTLDFTDLNGRVSTLESWANTGTSLESQINSYINSFAATLTVADTAVSHQFVTAVSQTNGKISVSRAPLGADDITTGTLGVSRGGTGANTFTSGQVLIGNGTEAIGTRAIDTTVSTGNNLITSGAVKSYVDNAISGLAGAMHFIGKATAIVTDGGTQDPIIDNYTTKTAGDVILAVDGVSEYVWTGTAWEVLGNESLYAVRGNITNSDIAANAAIDQTKIAGTATGSTSLADDLNKKVDKVDGKGLSTNDYTTAEKTKLSNIEAGAEVNTIESISLNNTPITPDANKNVNIAIDFATLGKVQGATVPGAVSGTEDITLNTTTHKLEFARIAKTGNVNDLIQTSGDVLILQCGTSSTVI